MFVIYRRWLEDGEIRELILEKANTLDGAQKIVDSYYEMMPDGVFGLREEGVYVAE